MERFGFIFLVAGLGFFALAFGVSAYLPTLPVSDLTVQSVERLAQNVPLEFTELKEQYPKAFRKAFYGKSDRQALTELQNRYPRVYERIFSKTDDQSLEHLKKRAPDLFQRIFGDLTVAQALDEFDYDREDILEKIKDADAALYVDAFENTIDSALAGLESDYALTLLRIRLEDEQAYREIFEERPDADVLAEALQIGLRVYIGEGCWHCHSQQVRPWGRDEARYGQISYPEEYHNALNYPPLWGTRRIGPDLIRRGGKHSNDWHVAHFANPPDTSPVSVMPAYPWFFEADGLTPNKKGLSIIAYVQWLGSWQHGREETIYSVADIERQHAAPTPVVPRTEPVSEGDAGPSYDNEDAY